MNIEEFEKLYHIMFEQREQQKEEDIFISQITIQNTKFNFYKNQNKHYLCKFNFQFLDEPQRVTVQFKGTSQLEFKITDTQSNDQVYNLKKFKDYFFPQFQLFKEAFQQFKQFLENKKKSKSQTNTLKVIPLDILMNSTLNKQIKINIDNVTFTFNQILNTFKDTYRVDFQLTQADNLDSQKFVTAVFKVISSQNYYILEVYLAKVQNDLQNAIKISKDQFKDKYYLYLIKLNKAIKTFLDLNN